MPIELDKGESLKLSLLIDGDVSSDHIRVYFAKGQVIPIKYSTDATDQAGDFFDIPTPTYDGGTTKTTVEVNVEATHSALLSTGSNDVTTWVSGTQAGFDEDFIRITKSVSAITVNQPVAAAEL